MNLRCLFHVSPLASTSEPTPPRKAMPSVVEIETDGTDVERPRGTSFETWNRARGWASED